MKIKQFRYSVDNLGYVVYGKKEAIAIDGGAVDDIFSFLSDNSLALTGVVNTHSHPDHTMGTKKLAEDAKAQIIDNETLRKAGQIQLEDKTIAVLHTPGHTLDSISFVFDGILVTGDTLFNGTVGNCFSGDLKGFFHSICKLLSYPSETIVYAGHDYVKESMEIAGKIDSDNPYIAKFMENYDPFHVYSTIEDELSINPYLRFDDPKMTSILEGRSLPAATKEERWNTLMNHF